MDNNTVLEIVKLLENKIEDLELLYLGYDEPYYGYQMQALEDFKNVLLNKIDA